MPMDQNLRRDARLNRAHILAAAQRRVDAGEDDVSLNVIAADAGVGVGTVYRHFPTQLALLTALIDPSLARLAATLQQLAQAGGSGGIEKAFRAAVDLFSERREALTVVSSANSLEPEASATLAAINTALSQLLDDAVRGGHVRRDITVEVLQHLVCAVDYASRLASDPATARLVHTEIALRGIQPT